MALNFKYMNKLILSSLFTLIPFFSYATNAEVNFLETSDRVLEFVGNKGPEDFAKFSEIGEIAFLLANSQIYFHDVLFAGFLRIDGEDFLTKNIELLKDNNSQIAKFLFPKKQEEANSFADLLTSYYFKGLEYGGALNQHESQAVIDALLAQWFSLGSQVAKALNQYNPKVLKSKVINNIYERLTIFEANMINKLFINDTTGAAVSYQNTRFLVTDELAPLLAKAKEENREHRFPN
ncbi:MAG: hypothetical protein H0W88_01580 [Parachlamydiaceae bacterium]|nr:hypothetical protein [Parachlamydiaceae bacterium]